MQESEARTALHGPIPGDPSAPQRTPDPGSHKRGKCHHHLPLSRSFPRITIVRVLKPDQIGFKHHLYHTELKFSSLSAKKGQELYQPFLKESINLSTNISSA